MTDRITLTLDARSLGALVKPVLPFTSDDRMVPLLGSVRITSTPEWLIAEATDRFRLGVHRIAALPDQPWPDGIDANVSAAVLRDIASTFKPARSSAGADIEIGFGESDIEVRSASAFDLFDSAVITYPLTEGTFPNVRKVLAAAIADAESALPGQRSLDPRLLASSVRGITSRAVTILPSDHGKPVVVTDGEDFVSVIMPRRPLRDSGVERGVDADLSSWTSILAAPEQAKKESTTKGKGAAA